MIFNCFQSQDPARRTSKDLDKKISNWMKSYSSIQKILLLGPGESGKTTIIKQMKIIHIQGFSEEERKEKKLEIRRNVLEAIKEITANMAFLQPPIPLADSNNRESLEFVHNVNMMQEYHGTQEFYDHVKRLWEDRGVRECFGRSGEYQLIDSAAYFLDRVDTIRDDNYIPSDRDILYCRKRTSDIQKIEFSMKVSKSYGGGTQQFCMFDVGGQRGERMKWIHVFDGITTVLFLVACSGFDSTIREDNATNRLEEAIKVFEDIWFSRFLKRSGMILFLNKQDILEEKVNRGVQMVDYFPEYANFELENGPEEIGNEEYFKVRAFIKHKFVTITSKENPTKRYSAADIYRDGADRRHKEFYCHYTTATDTTNIKKVFDDVHLMIMMWNLEKIRPS